MKKLQDTIGYQFADAELLTLALTHPSIAKAQNNQRLEFLGDAVLGLIIGEMLYRLYPDEQEGDLAKRLSALVRGETLVAVAKEIALGDALLLSPGETAAGGRTTASNLEDALEAFIGALYLDGGLDAAKSFVEPRWSKLAETTTAPPKDAKTSLQEWAQARALAVPTYALISQSGAAHSPEFTIEVTLSGYTPATATGNSKRAAEQEAAKKLLAQLGGL